MLCSKHYLQSSHFCLNDCCLFSRRKCQQCIEEEGQKCESNPSTNSSFFDTKKLEQTSRINSGNKYHFHQQEHLLLNYESLKQVLRETVDQIKQEFRQVVDNQNAYVKIHQIFNIIKEKIKSQLEQAEQHVLHSLQQFYQNIHKSDLSYKVNILEERFQNDTPERQKQNGFGKQRPKKQASQQNSLSTEDQINQFFSFSNKYLDEFIADILINQSKKGQSNPFSPLEIENMKLKEVFKQLKDLTSIAENFSSQSIGFLFQEKNIPEIGCTLKGKKDQQIQQQSKYKTNIMHQHSMQVKCVQNLGNQFIVSCGFDKKIKISTTLKNEKHALVEDVQLNHNIVCTDMIDSHFICGNEIGGGILFHQNKATFKKVSEFKLHDSLVYTVRFLTRDKIISGSINELSLFDVRKKKKIQSLKFSNNIITDICKLTQNTFLIGDSAGSISYYKDKSTKSQSLHLVRVYKIHKRPIVKLDIIQNDSKRIISGSRDQNIIIFNLLTSHIEKQIQLQNPLVTLCLLSPFEIVSSDSSTIYFHNVHTGELIYKIIPQTNSISCIDCNPLTKTIYLGQGKQVCSIQFS